MKIELDDLPHVAWLDLGGTSPNGYWLGELGEGLDLASDVQWG